MIWKLRNLNTEAVTSSPIMVHEAEASWTVNGQNGRYRIRKELAGY